MANLGSGFFGGEGGGGVLDNIISDVGFWEFWGGGITMDTHGLRGIMGDFNYLG